MPKPTPASVERISAHDLGLALGVSARYARDYPIPRDASGTYRLADVIQWAKGAGHFPTLDDSQHEAALQLAEELYLAWVDVLPELLQLTRGIGGDFASALAAVALVVHQDVIATVPASYALEPAGAPKMVVCEYCGRQRFGRKWKKRQADANAQVQQGLCPTCTTKSNGQLPEAN